MFFKVNCSLKGGFSSGPVETYSTGKYSFQLEQCKEEMSGNKEFSTN